MKIAANHPLGNRLRYKHLRMLVVLGASQNLHRASQTLNMSQPAATRMLQEIEDMFGSVLFKRLPRGMQPTPLGEKLVRFAESALNGLSRCTEDLELLRQGGYGYLTIGTIMGAAPGLVMEAVAAVKRQHPLLHIRIMGDTSDQVIKLLEQGEIDIAIARRTADVSKAYVFEPLGNENLLIVVRQGHPLTHAKHIDWPSLISDWPWILQTDSSPARIALALHLQRLALPLPRDSIVCGSVYSMQQLIQLTDSVMCLSESALHDYLRMGLVVALPVTLSETLAPFGLWMRQEDVLAPEQADFLHILRGLSEQQAGVVV